VEGEENGQPQAMRRICKKKRKVKGVGNALPTFSSDKSRPGRKDTDKLYLGEEGTTPRKGVRLFDLGASSYSFGSPKSAASLLRLLREKKSSATFSGKGNPPSPHSRGGESCPFRGIKHSDQRRRRGPRDASGEIS